MNEIIFSNLNVERHFEIKKLKFYSHFVFLMLPFPHFGRIKNKKFDLIKSSVSKVFIDKQVHLGKASSAISWRTICRTIL